ncbi:helix-turn-helix transcriptional regulator [Streptomyces sp. NPDC001020]
MPKTSEQNTKAPVAGNNSDAFIRLPWSTGRDDDHLYLGINVSDSTALLHPNSAHHMEPGDIVVAATFQPHAGQSKELAFFRVPFSMVRASRESLRGASVIHVSGKSGLPALVSQFLVALVKTSGSQRSTVSRRLALNTADLVALLIDEVFEHNKPDSTRPHRDMLDRIQAYIEENLADSDMSPESIARAHHISVRYLHKIFQADSTTVGAWIRQRRLDACRRDLRRRRRTVAAVAQNWGFTSPSHFSRLFRQTYGLSPKEWQASAHFDS